MRNISGSLAKVFLRVNRLCLFFALPSAFGLFFELLQSSGDFFAEFDLAGKDTAGPARNTFGFQLYAVLVIKVKVST